jgi:hypothetical protein
MYTLIRARLSGMQRYCWMGHIYDISAAGMRFELDSDLEPGTTVDVRAMLPGQNHFTFDVTGKIVRLHDDSHERGPVRMGMVFTHFHSTKDKQTLLEYLNLNLSAAA